MEADRLLDTLAEKLGETECKRLGHTLGIDTMADTLLVRKGKTSRNTRWCGGNETPLQFG